LAVVDPDQDPFSAAADRFDPVAAEPGIDRLDRRLDEDSAAVAGRTFRGNDAATDDRGDPAAHRFDFGEFRQRLRPGYLITDEKQGANETRDSGSKRWTFGP
jgi:hypothetical protein